MRSAIRRTSHRPTDVPDYAFANPSATTLHTVDRRSEHDQHHRRLSLRRHPLSGRGRTDRSCAVSLQRLQASRRRAGRRLDDVCRGRGQGDEGAAQGLRIHPSMVAGTSAPTAARGCSTSMRTSCPGSSIFRARPTTTPMPSRRWCISRPPSGCTGWSARTNCPASSAIRRRHSGSAFLVVASVPRVNRKRQFVQGRQRSSCASTILLEGKIFAPCTDCARFLTSR